MRPFRILMLGVGNGFAKSAHHNNALLEAEGKRFLIDCGATAWQSLHELGLGFEDIEGIFVTHLHYDHCGGLDEAALYGAYAANRKMKLWLPAPLESILWERRLRGALENDHENKRSLEDYFDVQTVREGESFRFASGRASAGGNGIDEESGPPLSARWLRTKHVPSRFSCSLVLDGRFFYSADMVADRKLVTGLYEDGIETFYHDCCFAPNPVHASFPDLLQYPGEIRSRTFLMHYAAAPDGMKEEELGGMKLLKQHEWRQW